MQFEEIFVEAPWGKIAALVGGNRQGKPVLCVHGTSDSANTLVPLVNRLPDGFWYVLIDLPGCGKSDHFPKGNLLNVIQFLVPLKILVDHFKLKDFIYIGHSMGANIGLFFHLRYPGLVERIVCIDAISLFMIEPERFFNFLEHYYDNFYNPKKYSIYNSITPSPTYTYEQVLELLIKSRGLTREAAICAAERNLIPVGDNLYRLSWDQRMKITTNLPLSFDYQRQLLNKINIPHLNILTYDFTRSRLHLVNPKIIDVFIESNPNYELALVNGNHDVHLNDPETVLKHVEPFICGVKQDRKTTLINREKIFIAFSKL